MGDTIYPTPSRLKRMEALVEGADAVGTLVIAGIVDTDATVTPASPAILARLTIGDIVWGAQDAGNNPSEVASIGATTFEMADPAEATAPSTPLFIVFNGAQYSMLQGRPIRAYLSSLLPTESTTLAELVAAEALYTGWTAPAGVWDTGVLTPDGAALAESQLVVGTPTAVLTPAVSIGGYWVDDEDDPIAIWPLDAAVILTGPTTPIKVLLLDAYPSPGSIVQILP